MLRACRRRLVDDGRGHHRSASSPAQSSPLSLFAPRVAVVVVPVGLPEAGVVLEPELEARGPTSRSSRSRGAARAAARGRRVPDRAARRRNSKATHAFPSRTSASGRLVVYPPSDRAVTYSRSSPLRSSSVSTETPFHVVSSFDHLVTQWMSTVTSSLGRARNSSHVQRRARPPRRRSRTSTPRAACGAWAQPTGRGSRA